MSGIKKNHLIATNSAVEAGGELLLQETPMYGVELF
jgi:hypothetical protein